MYNKKCSGTQAGVKHIVHKSSNGLIVEYEISLMNSVAPNLSVKSLRNYQS
jgi:hypothetical protein